MIYFIVALKAEAQAFIDKKIPVIISGIGADNMLKKTSQIVEKMSEDDKIVNVGICGANESYEIGELIDGFKENITCVDFEVKDKNIYNIVDMESSGFIEATKDIKNRYMFKVVSDHFQPESITKDMAKKLIFDKIDEILKRVK